MEDVVREPAVPAYAIALDVQGRKVVVAGGGAVAERKVRGLLESGALVCVVAPAVSAALRDLGERGTIEVRARGFEEADLAGAALAFAATDNADVNARVVAAARKRGVLVNDAGSAERGDFATPLVHRSGTLTFAIDTGGLSPSFAIRLRDELAERFDGRYARAAQTLGRIRSYVTTVVPAPLRAEVMRAFAERDIDDLAALDPVRAEHEAEAFAESLTTAPAAGAPLASATVATRASALAMWQTRHVMARLARSGIASTLLPISTKGDRVQDRSLAALGTDSIFVKELELALRERRADYAVHSCKDLPSDLPPDMQLAAIGERADPRDAFCSERYARFEELPSGALVGTSSPRRQAQLQALRPGLRFAPIRGNVDTRLRKLAAGEFDAILLAMAGLERLGLAAKHVVPFAPDVLVPAVGQGALAIETRHGDSLAARIEAVLGDPATTLAVRAERAFLRTLRGGCQAPVGAHGVYRAGRLELLAIIAAPDGSRVIRGSASEEVASPEAAEALAKSLALKLLAEGGDALLATVERGMSHADEPLGGRLFLLPRTQDRPSEIAPALRRAGARVVEAGDSTQAEARLAAQVPHVILFPSSGSVKVLGAYLAGLRAEGERPLVATMGEASSAAASDAGFPPDAVAPEPTTAAFVHSVTQLVLERAAFNGQTQRLKG